MFGAIVGGVSALAGIGQSIAGGIQKKRANEALANLERPEYTIPDAYYENLADTQRMASQGIPEAQQAMYEQQIDRATSQMLSAGTSSGDILRSAQMAGQMNQQGALQLLSRNQQARLDNTLRMMQARTAVADQEAMAWELNELDPYMMEYSNLTGQAQQGQMNVGGGLNTMLQGMGTAGLALDDAGVNPFKKDKVTTTATSPTPTYAMQGTSSSQTGLNTSFLNPPGYTNPWGGYNPNAGNVLYGMKTGGY